MHPYWHDFIKKEEDDNRWDESEEGNKNKDNQNTNIYFFFEIITQ